MNWFDAPTGQVVRLNAVDPGRILLTSTEKFAERSLLISLAYADQGGDRFHLSLSADPQLSGLVYQQNLNETAWDVSDVAKIEVTHNRFEIDTAGAAHGTIAVNESGARLISCNSHQDRAWFDLSTWNHARSAGMHRVSFPEWKLVVPNGRGDPDILFEWPPKKPATATGGSSFRGGA